MSFAALILVAEPLPYSIWLTGSIPNPSVIQTLDNATPPTKYDNSPRRLVLRSPLYWRTPKEVVMQTVSMEVVVELHAPVTYYRLYRHEDLSK